MDRSVPGGEQVGRAGRLFQIVLLILTTALAFAALALPLALRPAALPLKAGDVAPRDLQAPNDLEYVSQVRTEQARQIAADAVAPVYAPVDPGVSRQQLDGLRTTLDYISLVRLDAFASPQQKEADLAGLRDLSLSTDAIQTLLGLSPERWDLLQQEAQSVLEQVIRTAIRQEDLDTVRRSVPSLVSLSLNEGQAAAVAEIVIPFVAPNSLPSQDLTETARQQAREAVPPVVQSYKSGQTIVRAGQVITEVDFEALQQFSLIQPRQQWQDYLGMAAVTGLNAVFFGLYFFRRRPIFPADNRNLVLIAIILIVFLAGARLAIPNRTVVPYLYPMPAFGLLIATLFGMEAGLVLSVIGCVLAAYGLPNTLDLTLYYLMASLCGVLALGPARKVSTFLRAALVIAVAGMAALLSHRLPYTATDWVGLATLAAAALFNGFASASLTLLSQYLLAQSLGLTTALQLLEISRPDHPLLQFFLHNAPGTYQHSLQVANLAERAAEAIGADPLLTRVGALFHDVGKSLNPFFFIENQAPGSLDTHDDLAPEETAGIIINHVRDGQTLARRYRLPSRILDFISEHHGTLITRYQYRQALDAPGHDSSQVDIEHFRYPGPAPRSRETALLMLSDGVEARARAERPADEWTLRQLIKSVIDQYQQDGQLDNTRLTLRDLTLVMETFVKTMMGTYHPRIPYPSVENLPPEPATTPIRDPARKGRPR